MDWGSIFNNTFSNLLSIDAVYFAIAAIGLNVQFGYGGLLNFGQAGFMACGAYGMAMSTNYFGRGWWGDHLGNSPWWGLFFAIVFAIILGILMGIPTLRLRADYLAIVTIAAAEVIRLVVRSVRFKAFFGGSDGLNAFGTEFYETDFFLVGWIENGNRYGFGPFKYQGQALRMMIVGWILVAVLALLIWSLMRSPWGRVLKGIREDEEAVRSLGKNVFAYKMQALVLGGVIGSLAGVVFSMSRNSVQPDNYSREVTFYILTALVLGGVAKVTGSIVGPIIFWMLMSFMESFLIQAADPQGRVEFAGVEWIGQTSEIGQVRLMFVGAGLMLLMIFRPQGIFGNRQEMALDGR